MKKLTYTFICLSFLMFSGCSPETSKEVSKTETKDITLNEREVGILGDSLSFEGIELSDFQDTLSLNEGNLSVDIFPSISKQDGTDTTIKDTTYTVNAKCDTVFATVTDTLIETKTEIKTKEIIKEKDSLWNKIKTYLIIVISLLIGYGASKLS